MCLLTANFYLKGLWSHRSEKDARQAWESRFSRALESGLKPLVAFARKLEAYLPGIIAHAKWPLSLQRSSWKTTPRIQWRRFSIPQWARAAIRPRYRRPGETPPACKSLHRPGS